MPKIMNLTKRILPITLDSYDSKGNRNSLILARREVSRELTDDEMKSKQIIELRAKRSPRCPIKVIN